MVQPQMFLGEERECMLKPTLIPFSIQRNPLSPTPDKSPPATKLRRLPCKKIADASLKVKKRSEISCLRFKWILALVVFALFISLPELFYADNHRVATNLRPLEYQSTPQIDASLTLHEEMVVRRHLKCDPSFSLSQPPPPPFQLCMEALLSKKENVNPSPPPKYRGLLSKIFHLHNS